VADTYLLTIGLPFVDRKLENGLMQEAQKQLRRPRLFGPKYRWLYLLMWFFVLFSILLVQRLTALTFPTGNWMNWQATFEELVWYRLPPALIIGLTVLFFIALRWLVPEKGTRSIIRVWACFFSLIAVLTSFGISAWYSMFYFYID
jgi:hypothetical protein